jgi:hypothetical protein
MGLSFAIVPPYLTGSTEPYPARQHPVRPPFLPQRPGLVAAKNAVASAVIATVSVQLAVAQVTLALTVVFAATGALSRWRPAWLLGPAVLGLGWATAIGAGRAWSGYLGTARYFAVLLSAPGTLSAHLSALGAAAAHWHRWLPAQTSLALIVASAEAGVVGRLARRGGTYRPGLLVAARRCYIRVSLRRGEVATADGACLGVVTDMGRRAVVSWPEAAGGVLVTGQDRAAVTRTGLDLATAAILHRKTVIILDLAKEVVTGSRDLADGVTGSRDLADGVTGSRDAVVFRCVTSASADANAPLAVFGAGCCGYEPFADPRADTAAELLLSMTDGAGEGEARRAFCAEYIAAALEVMATSTTSPAEHSILDDLVALLRPGGLDAWAGPAWDPRLRRRVAALASQLRADPSAMTGMAEQLACLCRSPAGAALRAPANGAPTIDIGLALARRQVVLFPLSPSEHGPAGLMIARLVLADLFCALADRSGAPADCLVWINGCEVLGESRIAALIGRCTEAGLATIVGTPAGTAAAALADQVNAVAVRGRPPPGLTREAGLPGCDGLREVVPHHDSADALSMRVRGPVPRLLPGCRVAR